MREVAVIGVGMTKFGRFPEVSPRDMGREAVWKAIQDAGISPKDIEVAYCGNAVMGSITGQTCCLGQIALKEVGITGIPITNIENACASGSSAFREAWIAVASGLYDMALVLGIENLTASGSVEKTTEALAGASDVEIEGRLGLTMPSVWAMRAKRHMARYGTTLKQLAMVAVKNLKNGCLNPNSQRQKTVTVEEVLSSRMIADPLTLLQCSPISDGAAAAVLCSKEKASGYTTKPVIVAASVLTTGTYDHTREISTSEIEQRASSQAFETAGIGPEDLDLAEVHDCFSIAEIMRIENLGLCPPGEGGRWVEEGLTEMGGKLPVNPSGGLLSKGHPVGATGVAQIAELVWHLRGQAGKRQVKGAKVGLAHCSGGNIAGDTGATTVNILKG